MTQILWHNFTFSFVDFVHWHERCNQVKFYNFWKLFCSKLSGKKGMNLVKFYRLILMCLLFGLFDL